MSNEELIGKWMMERAIREGHRPGLTKSAEIQEETAGKIRTTMRRVTPENLRYEEVCLVALKSGPKSYTSGGQRQGSGFVLTYPLPDSTVLTYPLPDTTVLTTLFGHAINLHINDGETLAVDSFTLLNNNGNTVAATLLTQATDPKKFVPGHIAVLVPNAPLVAGNYTVIFWGKRNGTVFSRIWNFSVSYILNP